MKITKRLQTVLDRYNVKLRVGHSQVRHMTTGKVTDCEPLAFAVFDAAIKAVYLSNALHPDWPKMCEAGHGRHYQAIAVSNGFPLPDPSGVSDNNRETIGRRAARDYQYCASLNADAGLYFDLLD